MKRLAAWLFLATLIASSPALAQSAPDSVEAPQAAYNWSGYYAGISGGVAFFNGGKIISSSNVLAVATANNSSVTYLPSTSKNDTGISAGGVVGYNYQIGMIVFGGEADFSYAGLKSERMASGTSSNGMAYFAFDSVDKVDWYGTARARLGVTAFDRIMAYGTAGLAYGEVEASVSNSTTYPPNLGSPYSNLAGLLPQNWRGQTSEIKVGWTAGAGLQYALTDHVVLGAEYLYVDLGSTAATATYQGPQVNAEASQIYYAGTRANRFSVARATLGYKF